MKKFRAMTAACATATAAATVLSAAPAQAAQATQDGLVNVAVGDVTILEDVNIGVAANVIANICGVKVGPVAVLGRSVDRSGDTSTACEGATGPVDITQN